MLITSSLFSLILPTMFDSTNSMGLDKGPGNTPDFDSLGTSNGGGSEAPWWNGTYKYRRPISITNNNPEDFTDFTTFITINYTTYTPDKMQADLKDIRMIENGEEIPYYVEKDYNHSYYIQNQKNGTQTGAATIWFKTDIGASETQNDVYFYYGSDVVAGKGSTYMNNNPRGDAWYSFEEISTTGYGLTDVSGNRFNCTVNGNGQTTTGMVGNGYLLNSANNDYASLVDTISRPVISGEGMDPIAISVWFKRSSTTSSDIVRILSTDGSNFWALWLPDNQQGQIQFDTNYNDSTTTRLDGPVVQVNTWYHVVAIFNPQTAMKYLFINGSYYSSSEETEGVVLGDPNSDTGLDDDFAIGANVENSPTSPYFDGVIDEARIFRKNISANEINWHLYNNYELDTELEEEEDIGTDVTVTVKDTDGRLISGAEVLFWNASNQQEPQWDSGYYALNTSDASGETFFSDLPFGNYCITVNYTLLNGEEFVVYNSSTKADPYFEFSSLAKAETVYTDLWTVDFEVVDALGEPLNYGFVEVNNSGSSETLATLDLDQNGKAQYIGLKERTFDYGIYFENNDYENSPLLLNTSSVSYSKKTAQFLVNQSTEYSPGFSGYKISRVNPDIPILLDSTYDEVVEAFFDFSDMIEYITDIDIYLNESTTPEYIYDYDSEDDIENIRLNYSFYEDPNYNDIYGMAFNLEGYNNTGQCNGIVDVELRPTHVEHIETAMAKLNITIRDSIDQEPFQGIKVRVNNTDNNELISKDLVSNADGTVYGRDNSDALFWYKTDNTYNISLYWTWAGTQIIDYFVNSSDQSFDSGTIYTEYEYTLDDEGSNTIILDVDLGAGNRLTNLTQTSITDTEFTWGENIIITTNLTHIDTGAESDYSPDDGSGSVVCYIYDETDSLVKEIDLGFDGNGIYSTEFNSNDLSAGYNYEDYDFELVGTRPNYKQSTKELNNIRINAVDTGITLYNYSDLSELDTQENEYYLEIYHGQTVNISMDYFEDSTSTSLTPDKGYFSWSGQSQTDLIPDYVHAGNYVLEFDGSLADDTKEYTVKLTIGRENYSHFLNYEFTVNVKEIPTTINGDPDLGILINKELYVNKEYDFIFSYKNNLTGQAITELDANNQYFWEKEGTGTEGSGTFEVIGSNLVLDMDTENLSPGTYSINGFIQREFHEIKFITISLIINEREVTFELLSGSNDKVSSPQGESIKIKLKLTDPANFSAPLDGATVKFEFRNKNYSMTPLGEGIYQTSVSTAGINAILQGQAYSGTVHVNKTDYVADEYQITVEVTMTEIFPGFPLIYFIAIVSSVSAVVIAIGAYRYIQVARIPEFVKRTQSIKKEIKKGKSISDKYLYQTKEEYIAEWYGDDWEELDLSIEDSLGLDKGTKKKPGEDTMKGGAM